MENQQSKIVPDEFRVLKMAQVCHEMNRSFCELIGDLSQPSWGDASEWQKQSSVNGVKFYMENPKATPEDMHVNWMKEKMNTGWVHGLKKDEFAKTHPNIMPYGGLPETQKFKDALFCSTIKTFLRLEENGYSL